MKRLPWLLTFLPLVFSGCGGSMTEPQDEALGSTLNGQVRQVTTEVLIENVAVHVAGFTV